MKLGIRRFFSIMVAAPLFVGLAWFFGVFLQPNGSAGASFSFVLILLSALASMVVYGWLMRPGPKVRFRNRGVEGMEKDWGIGLMGASHQQGNKRRRDETDGDDFGSRRSSNDLDGDGDGLDDSSSFA